MRLKKMTVTLRKKTKSAILTIACCAFSTLADAEPNSVRLGPEVYGVRDDIAPGSTVRSLTKKQSVAFQEFVAGFDDCADIVAGPVYDGLPRDALRNTWTIIQSFRVDCWALLQANPDSRVDLAAGTDQITSDMILGIMRYSQKLSIGSEKWSKVLLDFSGGETVCKTLWRCRLSRPDGRSPPEQSVDFELIFANGSDRYIRVTQMIHGRSGFVYGVRWVESEKGGEVMSIFPVFD